MSIVASIAILTVAAFAASGGDTGGTVYATDFGYEADRNYDHWPDDWTRARGPRYPHFVEMGIGADDDGNPCFEIVLDGGAAVAFAPEFVPDGDHHYTVEAVLSTTGLRHDGCWLSVAFRAADGRTLATAQSQPLRGTQPWTNVKLSGLVAPAEAAVALVGIHVEPLGKRQDLAGSVRCRSLVVRQSPRLELRTSAAFHLHRDQEPIEVWCRVRGVDAELATNQNLKIRWELLDPKGHVIHVQQQPAAWMMASDLFAPQLAHLAAEGTLAMPGTCTGYWQVPRLEPGYYRVGAALVDGNTEVSRSETPLAVLAALPRPRHGTFCWTLPSARYRDELERLTPIFRNAGIQRIKLPLWLASDDTAGQDRMAIAVQQLAVHGIHTTGIIADPPTTVCEQLGWSGEVRAVDLLLKPADQWFPTLAAAMTRLAMSVPKWQLGLDRQRYLAELPDLNERMADFKNQARWHGLDINLGLGWNWLDPLPQAAEPPWSFLVYSASPPLAADELPGYLNRVLPVSRTSGKPAPATRDMATAPRPGVGCEVVIEPLDRRYELSVRLADLVQRMVVSLQHGVEGVVVPDPFHPVLGLCQPDGLPAELFVPWRTTSHLLGGSRYLGQITLPGGSTNALFERDGELVMVVWNERPTVEQLWLGERPVQFDVWGRQQAVPVSNTTRVPATWRYRHVVPVFEQAATVEEHRFQVGPVPTFIVGLDPAVAKTRISLQLARVRLPAEFGRNQNNAVRLESHFSEDVSGQVRMVAPDRWRIRPETFSLQLAPGDAFQHDFAMRPPFNADDGRQLLAFDFDLTGDRQYRFRAYQDLIVGADGLELSLFTWLDEHGNLVVEQRLSQSEPGKTAFQCNLSAPGRRIQVFLAHAVGPEPQVYRYTLPRGDELLGQPLTLRIEEQGGRQRVMQKRIIAEP